MIKCHMKVIQFERVLRVGDGQAETLLCAPLLADTSLEGLHAWGPFPALISFIAVSSMCTKAHSALFKGGGAGMATAGGQPQRPCRVSGPSSWQAHLHRHRGLKGEPLDAPRRLRSWPPWSHQHPLDQYDAVDACLGRRTPRSAAILVTIPSRRILSASHSSVMKWRGMCVKANRFHSRRWGDGTLTDDPSRF